jgi:hypothetical protein
MAQVRDNRSARIGCQGTEPWEQKTQESPGLWRFDRTALRQLTVAKCRDGSMLLKKDFRSRSEEESFTNGFLSGILTQVPCISDSIIAHCGWSTCSLIDFFNSIGHSRLRWSRPRLVHVRFNSDCVAKVGGTSSDRPNEQY